MSDRIMDRVPSRRVLVVEDDAAVRTLMSRHLRRSGFQVAEASDAETALSEMPEGSHYDLVLADVHLPGQSGVEMARQFRHLDAATPVIFMTGDPDEALARTALEEGAAGYMIKPFEFFELDAVVRSTFQSLGQKAISRYRDITRPVQDRGRFATWKTAIQQPERVVLRECRSTKRPLPFGAKAVVTVVFTLLLSWLTGTAFFTQSSQVTAEAGVVESFAPAKPATVFVPLMMESRTYEPRGSR